MLGQDVDTGARVGVVQGLKSQVRQRDVPLALILLMATADGQEERKDGCGNTDSEENIKHSKFNNPMINPPSLFRVTKSVEDTQSFKGVQKRKSCNIIKE